MASPLVVRRPAWLSAVHPRRGCRCDCGSSAAQLTFCAVFCAVFYLGRTRHRRRRPSLPTPREKNTRQHLVRCIHYAPVCSNAVSINAASSHARCADKKGRVHSRTDLVLGANSFFSRHVARVRQIVVVSTERGCFGDVPVAKPARVPMVCVREPALVSPGTINPRQGSRCRASVFCSVYKITVNVKQGVIYSRRPRPARNCKQPTCDLQFFSSACAAP